MPETKHQLHELLAVEQDARGNAAKILAETRKVFDRPEMFRGGFIVFKPFNEEDAHLAAEDHEELGTTVGKRLDYTAKSLVRYWDVVLQKEKTNQMAVSDIVVGSETLATGVPATMLLGLEDKILKFREAIDNMPTLDVKVAWEAAPDKGEGVWQTVHPEEKFRTRKVTEPVVLYEATKEHPAQVKEATKDIHVGRLSTTRFSGAVTSARKSEILENVDRLLRAVKKARQRANKQEIQKANIGKALFDFMLK